METLLLKCQVTCSQTFQNQDQTEILNSFKIASTQLGSNLKNDALNLNAFNFLKIQLNNETCL